MLLAAIVMIFMVLLVLSIAAPRIARQIQRDREQESAERANQYVRALRVYYLKFKHYPGSIEQLEKTNNQRFLRQKYDDPLTGKPDWRLIHVGENQTQVKGFFGEDLPGLPGMSGGSGMGTPIGGSAPSAFGGTNIGTPIGGASPTPGQNGPGGATGTTGTTGTTGSTGTTSSTGSSSSAFGGGGGLIMGVGSAKSGEAMLVVNEQTTYDTWEFLYDPRIEQLYAKATLLGGISSGTGTSGFGSGFGTPIGSSPTTPGTGTPTGTTPGPGGTPPTTTSPTGP